jgi:hypothetical protein
MNFPRFVTKCIYFASEGGADLGSSLFVISSSLYYDTSTPSVSNRAKQMT